MKITVKGSTKSDYYPCIKVFKDSGYTTIVLFTEVNIGILLKSDHPNNKMTFNKDTWAEYAFSLFDGVIELSNG